MNNKSFYNEILTRHNIYPDYKEEIDGANYTMDGVNPTCGDHITLSLRVNDGIIEDGGFTGDGCAISQASADIMLDMIIGKNVEEAKKLSTLFSKMIKGNITDEELNILDEAGALSDISHMPARVKCAVLGWKTFDLLLNDY